MSEVQTDAKPDIVKSKKVKRAHFRRYKGYTLVEVAFAAMIYIFDNYIEEELLPLRNYVICDENATEKVGDIIVALRKEKLYGISGHADRR